MPSQVDASQEVVKKLDVELPKKRAEPTIIIEQPEQRKIQMSGNQIEEILDSKITAPLRPEQVLMLPKPKQ